MILNQDKQEKEKVNEGFEELWEECYDLAELIEKTINRVLRYNAEFLRTGYIEGDENDEKVVKLLASLVQNLKKLPINDVVYSLQSVVFSTDDKGSVDGRYLETIKSGERDLSLTLNRSYDLFLHASKLENELLVERSWRLWNNAFRIYTHVQAVTKKFKVILTDHNTKTDATDTEEEQLWMILDSLLQAFRRKRLNGRTGRLLERIEELRQELSGGVSCEKLSAELMYVTAKQCLVSSELEEHGNTTTRGYSAY